MSVTLLEKPSVNYLEQLLHQASFDAEFRSELLGNPQAFGVPADIQLVVPTSVEKQDESLFELFDDALGELNIVAECKTTCSWGLTYVCDGYTKGW